MENRVAISQLVHLLNPVQLNSFTQALRYLQETPKTIYETSGQAMSMAQSKWLPASRLSKTNTAKGPAAVSVKPNAMVPGKKAIVKVAQHNLAVF